MIQYDNARLHCMVTVIIGKTCTISLQFQGKIAKNVYSARSVHSYTCILQSTLMTDEWLQKKCILHITYFFIITIIIY